MADVDYPEPREIAQAFQDPAAELKVRTLHALLLRPKRFSEIERYTKAKFPNQVTQTLKSLSQDGLVLRIVVGKGQQGIQYELTPFGLEVWQEWYFHNRFATVAQTMGYERNVKRVLGTTDDGQSQTESYTARRR